MSLLKTIASSPRRVFPWMISQSVEPLSTVAYDKFFLTGTKEKLQGSCFKIQQRRLIHSTHVSRDMENSVRVLGAGIAATGIIGPGIGMGILFGSMLNAISRNPSLSNKLFQYGIMGAALCESIAFFALMVAFVAMS